MSPQNYNGGFFNHYDDPDEFWDDEPLVVASSPPQPKTPPVATPRSPEPEPERPTVAPVTQRSSLVEVECGLDRLPIAITLKRAWKDMFAPAQDGRSIMDAYHHTIREMAFALVAAGTIPPATIPSLREAAPLLLRTRTDEEYTELYTELFTQQVHTVYGPGYSRDGRPGITVVARRSQLLAITVDPDWAVRADPRFIAQDIVDCCTQIRARKPALVRDPLLDRIPDSEVAARLVEHKRKLLESAA
ncbi:hypothetical protein AB0M34_10025 [Nocardia sp. NPDC050193]